MINKYQLIINKLCDAYDIPSIPVEIVLKNSLNSVQAYFDSIEYKIYVEEETSVEQLIHEWTHYCINLISKIGDLEENICDWVPRSVISDIEEDYPHINSLIKKTFPKEEESEPEQL